MKWEIYGLANQVLRMKRVKKKIIPWECWELALKVGFNPQIASLRWIETVADNYPPPLDNYLILKHEWPARWRSFIPDLSQQLKLVKLVVSVMSM
ncbi:hypothetical protein QL285_027587 [Trifolium repens]|nr:hypothetical protein QL285_027587 [Trifolium repens]